MTGPVFRLAAQVEYDQSRQVVRPVPKKFCAAENLWFVGGVNYLAHFYLAEDSVESQLGNFLGDFLKGVDRDAFPEAVRRGIQKHLKIDAYTDQHPVFRQSKARLSPERRRFAGVIIDIFYDHFLAVHWSDYHHEPLDVFSDRVITNLLGYTGFVPERARFVLERINQNGRLVSYRSVDAIGDVLDGISYRFRRENSMAGAVADLDIHYQALEADFFDFFPALQAFARDLE